MNFYTLMCMLTMMFFDFIDDMRFALTERPSIRRRKQIEEREARK